MKPLDAAARKRLEDAWRDPDVSREDLHARFRVNSKDMVRLRKELGDRPVVTSPACQFTAVASRVSGREKQRTGVVRMTKSAAGKVQRAVVAANLGGGMRRAA